MALERARMANCFIGISTGDILISRLLYVDDAVVLSPWSLDNARHIIRIFRFFYMASVLKLI